MTSKEKHAFVIGAVCAATMCKCDSPDKKLKMADDIVNAAKIFNDNSGVEAKSIDDMYELFVRFVMSGLVMDGV